MLLLTVAADGMGLIALVMSSASMQRLSTGVDSNQCQQYRIWVQYEYVLQQHNIYIVYDRRWQCHAYVADGIH